MMAAVKYPKVVIGDAFGQLTVLSSGVGRPSGTRVRKTWVCQCSCGKVITPMAQDLKSGRATSCGCLTREKLSKVHTKHGGAAGFRKSGTYSSWANMFQRCSNPNQKAYRNYGGRGIQVCSEWVDFRVFLSDMGERPEGLTLDRLDVNQGYSKANCRWASLEEQAVNRRYRGTQMISHEGITQSPRRWSEALGISLGTIQYRLRNRWPTQKILSTDNFNFRKG